MSMILAAVSSIILGFTFKSIEQTMFGGMDHRIAGLEANLHAKQQVLEILYCLLACLVLVIAFLLWLLFNFYKAHEKDQLKHEAHAHRLQAENEGERIKLETQAKKMYEEMVDAKNDYIEQLKKRVESLVEEEETRDRSHSNALQNHNPAMHPMPIFYHQPIFSTAASSKHPRSTTVEGVPLTVNEY